MTDVRAGDRPVHRVASRLAGWISVAVLGAGALLVPGTAVRTASDVAATAAVASQASAAADQAGFGVNVSTPNDWTTEWPFVDLFRTSRAWISQRKGAEWGNGPALSL